MRPSFSKMEKTSLIISSFPSDFGNLLGILNPEDDCQFFASPGKESDPQFHISPPSNTQFQRNMPESLSRPIGSLEKWNLSL